MLIAVNRATAIGHRGRSSPPGCHDRDDPVEQGRPGRATPGGARPGTGAGRRPSRPWPARAGRRRGRGRRGTGCDQAHAPPRARAADASPTTATGCGLRSEPSWCAKPTLQQGASCAGGWGDRGEPLGRHCREIEIDHDQVAEERGHGDVASANQELPEATAVIHRRDAMAPSRRGRVSLTTGPAAGSLSPHRARCYQQSSTTFPTGVFSSTPYTQLLRFSGCGRCATGGEPLSAAVRRHLLT